MAVFFTQKFGFLSCGELLKSIYQEMTSTKGNGKKYFNLKFFSTDIADNNINGWVNSGAPVGTVRVGVHHSTGAPINTAILDADWADNKGKMMILEATADADPLFDYQVDGSNANSTWRIMFREWMGPATVNSGSTSVGISVSLGTNIQLPDTGICALLNTREPPPANQGITAQSPFAKSIMPPGTLGDVWKSWAAPFETIPRYAQPNTIDAAEVNDLWINRSITNTRGNRLEGENNQRAYPMSYMMSITNRGFYVGVWEDSQEEIPQWKLSTITADDDDLSEGYGRSPFRWFLIQRGVDRITGHVRGGQVMRDDVDPATEKSRCPVYVVGGTTSVKQFYKFVARELDVVSPSRLKFAAIDMEDSPSCLNPFPQNSISESGEFVVNFINNLSTPRFRYADELDMVGTVGAEVIGAGTIIEVKVYGEKYPRRYIAAYATNKFGTGMRLMVLMEASEEDEDSHVYKLPETFSLTSNVANANKGDTIEFTLTTTNVSDNKRLFYHITDYSGNVTSTISKFDFTDISKYGEFVIQNNVATVTKTVSSAVSFSGNANIKMVVRKLPNQVGNILAMTGNITLAS